MGLTIHYSFIRVKQPESLLKKAEKIARTLGWEILDRGWNKLIIHPTEECESIDLHFHKVKNIKPAYKDGKMTEDWSIDGARLQDIKEPRPEEWFCGAFVKTHYAGWENHIKVAEFLRWFGSYCEQAIIHDESDYYENGYSVKEVERLKEFLDDYNKMMGNLGSDLKKVFGEGKVVSGGDF